MITNFDYLKNEPKFSAFANVAISAEKIILMDPEASIINSRRAMEFAIKWMYSVDKALEMPYQDNLQSLMNEEEYRQLVGADLWRRMDYIRRCGNNVAHGNKNSVEMRLCCVWRICSFFLIISHTAIQKILQNALLIKIRLLPEWKKPENQKWQQKYKEKNWKKNRKSLQRQELDLKKLIAENASLREELSARRQGTAADLCSKNLLIYLSIRQENFISIPCLQMRAGQKAKTG